MIRNGSKIRNGSPQKNVARVNMVTTGKSCITFIKAFDCLIELSIRDQSISTYAKFSEKLTTLTPYFCVHT